MEQQWRDFHPDVQRLSLEEWLGTKGGIVGDGNIVGDQAAGENREAQISQGHLAPESIGELRFQRGTEGIGIDEQRYKQNSEQQENDNGDKNANQRMLFHG